jgi:hypothetical protein
VMTTRRVGMRPMNRRMTNFVMVGVPGKAGAGRAGSRGIQVTYFLTKNFGS